METPAISKRLELIGVVALLLVLLVQAGLSIERISLTSDEHTHIPAGFTYWKARDFRLNPEHPPLAKLNLEEPAAFNRAIADFLAAVDAGRWEMRDPRSIADSILGER